MKTMTCWSCRYWRPQGCALRNEWFPKRCEEFDYEPGSDEEERDDRRRED